MKWIPERPIQSTLEPRLNINNQKSDLALDFGEDGADLLVENGDLKMVSGKDAFIQQVKTVLLTTRTEFFTFGLKHLLPRSSEQNQFNEECLLLAESLVSDQDSESTPSDPSGLGYTLETIESIEYTDSKLKITMTVTGLDEKLTIDVYAPLANRA
ncbi:hypothetical protein H8R29_23745 [Priestia megaterium]|uniref:Uncharacterized protein n=1 Tax=Priestia megaterium (strain ATCC 14581 / DSM 32 / CCUG 1817 / JCM 2506 / NBRC 15308 / NCIMB 9376 / NCTC 10342 / NRRL B-14308 / VKM B-512 / Ford 19) TaxID=1348623 RepID=A0A0B6AKF9_PRIM2|nr:hypothetical protein [Priestia megaterium]AJI20294.1 hypothetical protein BG04_1480 [Priestia megaterium NBRC 15308 = ATCC 14581]KGJ84205.1 hypothetical protein BMT_13040 [Priestia megaterium NBRC 15308 = ATCC 14581]MDR4230422.1 hypothetical protein [Priestia megaterium]MED3805569.1 hypothetical protein [Priestia megaterium]MED4396283.1 hypothetical protein [Priestia megaterium]